MFGKPKPTDIMITFASEQDLGEVADLHDASFSRGWSTSELMAMFQRKGMLFLIAREVGKKDRSICGFNIIRQTELEAEIISIGVSPALRGREIGLRLMREAISRLVGDRIPCLFLEVDESNQSAISLYRRLGFQTVGNRPAYYAGSAADDDQSSTPPPGKAPSNALVMRLDLG